MATGPPRTCQGDADGAWLAGASIVRVTSSAGRRTESTDNPEGPTALVPLGAARPTPRWREIGANARRGAAQRSKETRDGENGYYHLRARQYDPGIGHFTQADPLGYAGRDNLYAYAGNNPGTNTDPAGLFAVWGAIEAGLSLYDAYDTQRTLRDPNAGVGEKWATAGLFAAGLVAPGGGGLLPSASSRARAPQVGWNRPLHELLPQTWAPGPTQLEQHASWRGIWGNRMTMPGMPLPIAWGAGAGQSRATSSPRT